jgi:2-polyprenyl-3-methyl-5-hydroxy-6-metoxy-1,4-benzoquinol methylase
MIANMNSRNSTQEFLEQSAADYHDKIVDGWQNLYQKKREYLYQCLKKYQVRDRALELGSADGIMTQKLCHDFKAITVVDGSAAFLQQVREKVKADNLHLVHSLFEDYSTEEKFNTIFMTHILEHLDDPVAVLRRSQEWLAIGGRLLIAVPNANSLHRLVGVKMGMLPHKDALNEQDRMLGHQRVYTPDLLKQHVREAGFKVVHFGGVMVKPISNRQIEQQWSDELIDAYFALGEDMPELCSEIYVVAEKE